MSLTKAGLIGQVHASNPKLEKAQVYEAVEVFLRIIKSSLERNKDIFASGY